jgi:hypothetical protein
MRDQSRDVIERCGPDRDRADREAMRLKMS